MPSTFSAAGRSNSEISDMTRREARGKIKGTRRKREDQIYAECGTEDGRNQEEIARNGAQKSETKETR